MMDRAVQIDSSRRKRRVAAIRCHSCERASLITCDRSALVVTDLSEPGPGGGGKKPRNFRRSHELKA